MGDYYNNWLTEMNICLYFCLLLSERFASLEGRCLVKGCNFIIYGVDDKVELEIDTKISFRALEALNL